MVYFFLLLALTANAIANILMKLASQSFPGGLLDIVQEPGLVLKNGYLFAGVFSFGIALVLYALVLSQMKLSVAYPIMTSLGFVIVVGFSVLSLQEQLFWWQWVGVGLILVGVVLLSQGS